jgi:hypothetical protein
LRLIQKEAVRGESAPFARAAVTEPAEDKNTVEMIGVAKQESEGESESESEEEKKEVKKAKKAKKPRKKKAKKPKKTDADIDFGEALPFSVDAEAQWELFLQEAEPFLDTGDLDSALEVLTRTNVSVNHDLVSKLIELATRTAPNSEKLGAFFQKLYSAHLRPNPVIETALYFPNKANDIKVGNLLMRARKTIDIAIFAFTNNILCEALKRQHKAGVKIRIICDDQCAKFNGCDVWPLAVEGIEVTMDDHYRYHMHNKFVIIDSQVLLNGSFNWTAQAVYGN